MNFLRNSFRNLWKNFIRISWSNSVTTSIKLIFRNKFQISIEKICEKSKMNSRGNCIRICRNCENPKAIHGGIPAGDPGDSPDGVHGGISEGVPGRTPRGLVGGNWDGILKEHRKEFMKQTRKKNFWGNCGRIYWRKHERNPERNSWRHCSRISCRSLRSKLCRDSINSYGRNL